MFKHEPKEKRPQHLRLIPSKGAFRCVIQPLSPYIKINVNEAICLNSGVRGLGAVLQNENGDLILVGSEGLIGNFNPKATELYATSMVCIS